MLFSHCVQNQRNNNKNVWSDTIFLISNFISEIYGLNWNVQIVRCCPMASQNIKILNMSWVLKAFAMDGNKTRFSRKLYESDHVVKIMCWSNLQLYKAFYRHMRVQVHRQHALWELPNAVQLMFSYVFWQYDAQTTYFVRFGGPGPWGINFFFGVFFYRFLALRGTIKGGVQDNEYRLLTTDYLLLTTYYWLLTT